MRNASRVVTALAVLCVPFLTASMHAGGKRRDLPVPATGGPLLAIRAELDGVSALPGNSEPASGSVAGTYDPATHVLRFRAYFVDLSGQATNAKFYGAAGVDHAGWPTVAAPRPEASLVTGTALLDQEEERDLLDGRWFFNVTTQKHPEGEIRGAVRVVPEPINATNNERNEP